MKLSLFVLVAVAFLPSLALADDAGSITVVDGKFADHLEQGRPAGAAKEIAATHKAVYWVDVANTGEATQLTLVWTIDGKEAARQSLDVGRSPHWHTWGSHPIRGAHKIDVQVLDASGKSLKEDSVSLEG